MTDEHKKALAEGRAQGRSVKQYLDALEENKPKRGRKRTPESIKKRLAAIEDQLASASSLKRLNLLQERSDLSEELERETSEDKVDLSELEAEFVKVAKDYGERKGIAYGTWREMGVPAATLKQAGITRGSG